MKKKLLSISVFGLMLLGINQTNAQAGTALNFNGTNNYCSSAVFSTLTNNITLEARVSWTGATTGNEMIITNGNTGNSGYAIFVDNSNSNQLSVVLGGVFVLQSAATLTAGGWNMVSLVCHSGTWILYVDGVSYTLTGNTSVPNAVSGAFAIGSDQAGTENFNGTIDEVRFWNRALSQYEIQYRLGCSATGNAPGLIAFYNFNEGVAGANNSGVTTLADSSGNSNNLTLTNFALNGATSNWIAPAGMLNTYCSPLAGAALNFDGVNDYVTVPYAEATTNITHEFWFNTTVASQGLFSITGGNPPVSSFDRDVYLDASGNINVYVWDNGSGTQTIRSSGTNYADGNWHHLSYVMGIAAGGQKIYMDGVLAASGSYISSAFNSNNTILIGYSIIGANPYFTGSIDEVRIWNTCRTQCQMNNTMNCELAPSDRTGLVAYYKFNEGYSAVANSGVTTAADSSGQTNTGTLMNFALSGTTSNWVAPGAVTSGVSCDPIVYPTVTVNSPSICVGTTATLTAGGTATTYTWSTSATTTSITATPTVTTSYTVTGADANNCMTSTVSTISVDPTPAPTISSQSGSFNACGNVSATFSVNSTGTYTYTWYWATVGSPVDPTSATLDNGTYSETGYTTNSITVPNLESEDWNGYFFFCVVTNSVNCTAISNPDTITVNSLPTVGITASSATVCAGSTATLTASGATTYTWSNTGAMTTAITPSPTTTIQYTVTGTDANGCMNTDTLTIMVNNCTTGLNNFANSNQISVYPNPNNGNFVVTTTENTNTITVTDILGNELMSVTPTNTTTNINLNAQPSGVYFIKVTVNGTQTVKRIIINN